MSKLVKTRILMTLLGLILVACLAQGEFLLLPHAMGALGWILYRIAFCIIIPPRLIAMLLAPQDAAHFWPLSHWLLLGLLTPLYLEMLRLGWNRFSFRYNIRDRLPLPAKRRVTVLQSKNTPSHSEWLKRGPEEKDLLFLDRRQFLYSAVAGTLGVATGGMGGYAALVEPTKLQIRYYHLSIKDLPAELAGLRLIHASDTHYGPFVTMQTLEKAVDTINRLHGDLVLLTGDYMHRTRRSLKPGIGVLGGIKARLGVAAVLGNHDHWEGTHDCYKAFDGIGVPLVDNRHLYLSPDGFCKNGKFPVGRSLAIAGVGDLWEDEVSFRKALSAIPHDVPRLMLAHNPDVAEMIDPAWRVDLMLSGHTHGGQVSLPMLGPPKVGEYGHKYLGGLCQGPACPVIVSRGVGMSGLPLRLGVPPEIGVITLVRA